MTIVVNPSSGLTHEYSAIRGLPLIPESPTVEIASDFRVEDRVKRLIQGLNGGDHIIILGTGIFFLNLPQYPQSLFNIVAFLPFRFRHAPA